MEPAEKVRQIAVPPEARALATLPRVDYADAFLVEVGGIRDRTPEEWARAILEDAPESLRRSLTLGWSALGLKLGSNRSDRHVLGWEVRRSTPDHVLLGAGSRIGMPAELLVKRQGERLLFSTFVQHENLLARAVWAGVEPAHCPIVRSVLSRVRPMHPFRAAIEEWDLDAVRSLLSEDVVFRSPIVFKPYRGRDAVGAILEAVSQVFEDFAYTREIGAPGAPDHALVFQARVGDKQVEGCDFLHVDESGAIDELVVMVRPLSGALALAEAMKAQLAAAEAG